MPAKIFKAVDSPFISSYFGKKKNYLFPDCRKKEIKEVKIEQVSPSWAKATCLAKYRIIFEDNSEKVARGTAKADSSKKNVWKVMNYLYENRPVKTDLAVPRPLHYLEEINLLLYEEAPGTPLVLVLGEKNEERKIGAIRKAAAWLSWLHSLSPGKKNLPKATFIGSDGYKKTLVKIEKNIPEFKKYLFKKSEVNFVDQIWSFEKRVIHNDFYPGNSIVGKRTFFGIDFDRAGFGPPLMDVAALFSFFDFSKKMWPQKLTGKEPERLRSAFLEEYCRINGFSTTKIAQKIHPFLVKSFLDQLHYYTSFFLKGRRFMDKESKDHFSSIIKDILIKIKEFNNEK